MAGRGMGAADIDCVCDICVVNKMRMLRQAPPHVQRSILTHIPPNLVPPEPMPSSSRSPNGSLSAPSGGQAGDGDGAGALPSTHSCQQPLLHSSSLFELPLWPTSLDAEFDGAAGGPRTPSTRNNIIIPPLVQRRIPAIKDCIKYVLENSNITGPRKEAAILEAIDEILAICERKILEETPTQ